MALNTNDAINILNTDNALGIGSGGSLLVFGGTSIGKDLYVGGNIAISGTASAFSDNMIILNNQANVSSDTGVLFQRYSGDITDSKNYSSIIYSETNDKFIFSYVSEDVGKSLSTNGNYIGLQAYNLTLENTNNALGLGSGGALTVNGGVSVKNDTYLGGKLNITGDIVNGNLIYTTGGNLGLSNTTPAYKLDINGSVNLTGNIYKNGNMYASDSLWEASNNDIFYTKGNIGIGTTSPGYKLHVMGPIYSSDRITAFSDIRFKENIKTLSNTLNKVERCRGVSYKKIDTGENHVGFIAQELETVFPEVVFTDEMSGLKSVAYGNITAILLESIKELSQRLKRMESKFK